ncbi:hypothetical protein [Streptomyces sp. NPDC048442]|uniref:hypothetical protein n=1 Tax=Streptomyces sp. NPDC048442 TaxID=3154823 RepID=UPI00342D30BF
MLREHDRPGGASIGLIDQEDPHLYLGSEQAAVRLGVRRSDLDELRRLGWLRPLVEA